MFIRHCSAIKYNSVSFTNTKLCEQQTKQSVLPLIPLSQTSRIGENLNTVPEVRRVVALVEMEN